MKERKKNEKNIYFPVGLNDGFRVSSAKVQIVIVQTEKGNVVISVSQGDEILQEPFFEIHDARLKTSPLRDDVRFLD